MHGSNRGGGMLALNTGGGLVGYCNAGCPLLLMLLLLLLLLFRPTFRPLLPLLLFGVFCGSLPFSPCCCCGCCSSSSSSSENLASPSIRRRASAYSCFRCSRDLTGGLFTAASLSRALSAAGLLLLIDAADVAQSLSSSKGLGPLADAEAEEEEGLAEGRLRIVNLGGAAATAPPTVSVGRIAIRRTPGTLLDCGAAAAALLEFLSNRILFVN